MGLQKGPSVVHSQPSWAFPDSPPKRPRGTAMRPASACLPEPTLSFAISQHLLPEDASPTRRGLLPAWHTIAPAAPGGFTL